MAAAIGSPSRASASAIAPPRSAAPAPAVLRVAAPAGPGRRGAVAAAAMQPAKAAALEAAPAAAGLGNGAAVAGMARPDAMGRFGKFGGKYVPETLMHALTELEAAFHALATDDEFQVTPPASSFSDSSLCRTSDSRDSLVVGARRSTFTRWEELSDLGTLVRSMGVVSPDGSLCVCDSLYLGDAAKQIKLPPE